MAASYSDVPPGGLLNVPPSIPSGMLYRVKQIQGISKQTLKITPLSGQTSATNGQKIIFALPPNSLVDLSTLEMNFVGLTQHRGNNAATNCANYVQKAYFPRNTASIIENLEKTALNRCKSRQHHKNKGGKVSTVISGPFANKPKPKATKNR